MKKERIMQILLDYISDDENAACEHDYVFLKLKNICCCSDDEIRELGYGFFLDELEDEFTLFMPCEIEDDYELEEEDEYDEEEEDDYMPDCDDPYLEVGYDPYAGCYSEDL
ncbi:MAG: hypothetical protein IK121_03160 [Lachnospiraceae bacterium]|nr:hypothetical protein [Lachnospiraceae bacterium]